MENNDIYKSLDYLQDNIKRMSQNGFHTKEWAITLIAALSALNVSINSIALSVVTIVATLIFWYLNAFYLSSERKFRKKYRENIKKLGDLQSIFEFEQNGGNKPIKIRIIDTISSKSIFPFYVSILVCTITLLVWTICIQ
jgi:spore maturation protein CgeB